MSLIIPGQNGSANQSPEIITTPTGVIYRFTQSTKPTQRPSGPLEIGDRWEKSDDGTEWFWNGTYWLSKQIFSLPIPNPVANAHTAFPAPPAGVTTLFVESCTLAQQSGNTGNNDANNYRNYNFLLREKASGNEVTLAVVQNYPLISLTANSWTIAVNTPFPFGNYSGALVRALAGAGTDYSYGHYTPVIRYRWAH